MTRGKRFKRLVRARAAQTGQSYTGALRRFQPRPKEGNQVTVDTSTETAKCSFCGKSQEEVTRLVAGPGVYICDQCIRVGYDIVGGERQGDHRPMPEFARFSDRARASLVEAQQAARELGHNFLGSEHLLLGVLMVTDGQLGELLSSHGLHTDGVRTTVSNLVGPSKGPALGAPPFTPRAMRALQLAGDRATELGQDGIDAAHLVLGLLAEGHGIASQLLQAAGIGLRDLENIARAG